MLHQLEARHLLSTRCPMSEEQLRVVQLVDEGIPIEAVAERLGEPLDAVKDIVEGVVKEFEPYLA